MRRSLSLVIQPHETPPMKLSFTLRLALAVATFSVLFTSGARAQGRGGIGIGGNTHTIRSPEVGVDGRVTFRLLAPGAQVVTLAGDFTGDTIPMKKDGAGVWSYSTDTIKPGYYQYWFTMDGLTMPDPVNSYVRPASGVFKSQIDIPGPGTEWMDFRDVPHGALHEHWYVNKENGTARRVVVYTPPGYARSTQSYPVVYLLHGNADFERGWTQAGRANLIMDNLIADGKSQPAILVMPFGHNVSGSTGKFAEVNFLQKQLGVTPTNFPSPAIPATGPITSGSAGFTGTAAGNIGGPNAAVGAGRGPGAAPAGAAPVAAAPGGAPGARGGGRGGPNLGAAYMENDLLGLVIPLVEREYRVKAEKSQRAIVGYSMGGGHSTAIGLNHPELFDYVGAFSGVMNPAGIAKALADPAKTNKDFKLIWVGCGTADTTAYPGSESFHELLASKGITHEWVESEGYRHDYQIWRLYLRDLMPKLFK